MRHVLVIEDEYLTARCVKDMVLYAGATSAEVASSEEAAVKAAERHRPGIIIADVDLKRGGREPDAVARIHMLYGAIPTIFLTGDLHDPHAHALGRVVLAKPVSAEQFAAEFRAIVSELPAWSDPVDTDTPVLDATDIA